MWEAVLISPRNQAWEIISPASDPETAGEKSRENSLAKSIDERQSPTERTGVSSNKSMKQDIRGPIFAVAFLLVLSFGVYWGVAVYPKKDKFWTTVTSVANVTGGRIDMGGNTVKIDEADARRIFELIRSSPDYLPNHPATIRNGMIAFDTNIEKIAFSLLDTNNQGILLCAFSSGNSGWNYGTRRCDEIARYLPVLEHKRGVQQVAP